MSLKQIGRYDPDLILPPDPAFVRQYWDRVDFGRRKAAEARVAFVGICRNAMPWLGLTLKRIEDTGSLFKDWRCFVYEND